MTKIAIVEDNQLLHQSLCIAMEQAGYSPLSAYSVQEGLNLIASKPDLFVIDIGLPDGEGFQIAQAIKQTPIVFLTARDAEVDMIKAFDHGCEDYVVKPFSMQIFLKRIKAILRRCQIDHDQLLIGHLLIDYEKKQVKIAEQPVQLTPKEYQLLEYLARNSGQTLSKEAILAAVWDIDGQFVGVNTVSLTINRLKKKIEVLENDVYIKNIFGLGYIFGDL